jgi:hypothetical protein
MGWLSVIASQLRGWPPRRLARSAFLLARGTRLAADIMG